jgi:hypothetical protein
VLLPAPWGFFLPFLRYNLTLVDKLSEKFQQLTGKGGLAVEVGGISYPGKCWKKILDWSIQKQFCCKLH